MQRLAPGVDLSSAIDADIESFLAKELPCISLAKQYQLFLKMHEEKATAEQHQVTEELYQAIQKKIVDKYPHENLTEIKRIIALKLGWRALREQIADEKQVDDQLEDAKSRFIKDKLTSHWLSILEGHEDTISSPVHSSQRKIAALQHLTRIELLEISRKLFMYVNIRLYDVDEKSAAVITEKNEIIDLLRLYNQLRSEAKNITAELAAANSSDAKVSADEQVKLKQLNWLLIIMKRKFLDIEREAALVAIHDDNRKQRDVNELSSAFLTWNNFRKEEEKLNELRKDAGLPEREISWKNFRDTVGKLVGKRQFFYQQLNVSKKQDDLKVEMFVGKRNRFYQQLSVSKKQDDPEKFDFSQLASLSGEQNALENKENKLAQTLDTRVQLLKPEVVGIHYPLDSVISMFTKYHSTYFLTWRHHRAVAREIVQYLMSIKNKNDNNRLAITYLKTRFFGVSMNGDLELSGGFMRSVSLSIAILEESVCPSASVIDSKREVKPYILKLPKTLYRKA